jgi:hypothetical protein
MIIRRNPLREGAYLSEKKWYLYYTSMYKEVIDLSRKWPYHKNWKYTRKEREDIGVPKFRNPPM